MFTIFANLVGKETSKFCLKGIFLLSEDELLCILLVIYILCECVCVCVCVLCERRLYFHTLCPLYAFVHFKK